VTGAAGPSFVQNVTAVDGFAYGVIGADIHVFGSGLPLYLLANWRPEPEANQDWLRELPSRMLNARRAVVPFTGRDAELAGLREWRDNGSRLAVRWLYGPGGQGKTRLVAQIAADSAAAGWKVVAAFHGPDADPAEPGSQDMTLNGAAGLLVIVDYADRWLLQNLTWLIKNRLLHHKDVATRVIMVGRTADAWPRIRGILDSYQAGMSSQLLSALPAESGARATTFTAARNRFAEIYELPDVSGISLPTTASQPEFGLTLALHMAALVAVDACASGQRAPKDMVGLTVYLLDREQLHWARRYADGASAAESEGVCYRTPPEVMNQAVYMAALTGAVDRAAGVAVLEKVQLPAPDQILNDHGLCYPPADPATAAVLEPLYPDRLAEDFLALTLPGHRADYPAQQWAPGTLTSLLARAGAERAPVSWTPRAVTFLASAAQRWEHLGSGYLFPLLRREPQLVIDAGSAALIALSGIKDMDFAVLETVDDQLPERHVDLDPGIAALTRRLTEHQLEQAADDAARAPLLAHLGFRYSHAGLDREALAATEQAVTAYRRAAQANPAAESHLAMALTNLGAFLSDLGRWDQAVAADEESVAIRRRLATETPRGAGKAEPTAENLSYLAWTLHNLSVDYSTLGRTQAALDTEEEAVDIYRRLNAIDPSATAPDLAMALDGLAGKLREVGRYNEALPPSREAVTIRRQLTAADPAMYEPNLAASLVNLGDHLAELGQLTESLEVTTDGVARYRRLATANPAAYDRGLAQALTSYGVRLSQSGCKDEASAADDEAVAVYQRLAAANPAAFEPGLARALSNRASSLLNCGKPQDALLRSGEAVAMYRQMAPASGGTLEILLANALFNQGSSLLALEKSAEASSSLGEAITLYQSLEHTNPAAHPGLARALTTFAVALAASGDPVRALEKAEEGVAGYRQLADSDPVAHGPALAGALGVLSSRLLELGREDEASAAAAEAAAIRPARNSP
jgi:tetratricopeptide (TPR) repeat protein